MKRRLKGFTLIELIVVIAIFGILMTGLMNFFRPVRQTYVDSTLYDQQRTTQNGILEYLCETTRYASAITIYDQGCKVGTETIDTAVKAKDQFITDNSIADASKVRVIVINRSDNFDKTGTYFSGTYDDKFLHGRLITNIDGKEFKDADHGKRTETGNTNGDTYMALGDAYYGESNFAIYIDDVYSENGYNGIRFAVVSSLTDNGNVVSSGGTNGGSQLDVSGDLINLKTVQENVTHNCKATYEKHVSGEKNGSPSAVQPDPTKLNLNNGKLNTYIVFVMPDETQL